MLGLPVLILLVMVSGSNMLGLPMSMQDWSAMLKPVGSSVSQATVLLDELTEGIAAAAVEGASVVSRGRQGGDVGPQVAVELLWRLRHLGLSDKAEGTKVTSSPFSWLSQNSLCLLASRSALSVLHFIVLRVVVPCSMASRQAVFNVKGLCRKAHNLYSIVDLEWKILTAHRMEDFNCPFEKNEGAHVLVFPPN